MALFFRRRRPLMRLVAGAAVAGTACHKGTSRAGKDELDDQAYRATQGPPAPSSMVAPDTSTELARLAELHESGALTDDEFAAAKAKVLGG